MCSEPGFEASVSVSRTTSGAGSPSRPRLWAARRWPRLRPLPHPLRLQLRWYRHLIAAKYDGSKNRSPGQPPTAKDIRELIVRVARENPTWEYTRLRGALKNLKHRYYAADFMVYFKRAEFWHRTGFHLTARMVSSLPVKRVPSPTWGQECLGRRSERWGMSRRMLNLG